jgi:hypothetical protein
MRFAVSIVGKEATMNRSANAQLAQKIESRAQSDSGFRRDLMTDPRDTIEREYDYRVPSDVEVRVFASGKRTTDPVHVELVADGNETRGDFYWTMLDRYVERAMTGAAHRGR